MIRSERGVASKVLVVEDYVDAAELLADVLRDKGHTVRVAFDGPSALQEARRFEPDVVLLDIGLPQMDGYEVARRLRALPGLEHTPIVGVTGYAEPTDFERSKACGIIAHLTKPVDMEELERVLEARVE